MCEAGTTGRGNFPHPVAPAEAGVGKILNKYPRIPITDPEKQMDAVLDFCTAWDGPLHLVCQGRGYLLVPFEHYLSVSCTPEEAEEIRKQLVEYSAEHPETEAE